MANTMQTDMAFLGILPGRWAERMVRRASRGD